MQSVRGPCFYHQPTCPQDVRMIRSPIGPLRHSGVEVAPHPRHVCPSCACSSPFCRVKQNTDDTIPSVFPWQMAYLPFRRWRVFVRYPASRLELRIGLGSSGMEHLHPVAGALYHSLHLFCRWRPGLREYSTVQQVGAVVHNNTIRLQHLERRVLSGCDCAGFLAGYLMEIQPGRRRLSRRHHRGFLIFPPIPEWW